MDCFTLLKQISGQVHLETLMDIFCVEAQKNFLFDTCAFYQIKNQNRLQIAFLKTSPRYKKLGDVYQDMELNLGEFPFLNRCLKEKKLLNIGTNEIQQEHNPITKRLQFFEIDTLVKDVVFFPVISPDGISLGILALNSYQNTIKNTEIDAIQELLLLFTPIIQANLFVRDLIKKQAHIEKITGRYQRILQFIIHFNQLLDLNQYFELLTQEMHRIFGFEVCLIQFEEQGKLPIQFGGGVGEEHEAIFKAQKDYFSLKKNAPFIRGEKGPEMACSLLFLNQTHYYVEDASVFYEKKMAFLPKDQEALKMMKKPLKTMFHIPNYR